MIYLIRPAAPAEGVALLNTPPVGDRVAYRGDEVMIRREEGGVRALRGSVPSDVVRTAPRPLGGAGIGTLGGDLHA